MIGPIAAAEQLDRLSLIAFIAGRLSTITARWREIMLSVVTRPLVLDAQMIVEILPLADIMANDPGVEVLEDHRKGHGYLLVKCPNDDGTDDHALHVCNPGDGLPAMAYCLSRDCQHLSTLEMIELLDAAMRAAQQH